MTVVSDQFSVVSKTKRIPAARIVGLIPDH